MAFSTGDLYHATVYSGLYFCFYYFILFLHILAPEEEHFVGIFFQKMIYLLRFTFFFNSCNVLASDEEYFIFIVYFIVLYFYCSFIFISFILFSVPSGVRWQRIG